MSILTGNILSVILIVTSLFVPSPLGVSVILFIIGLSLWVVSLRFEREKHISELNLEVYKREKTSKENKTGRMI